MNDFILKLLEKEFRPTSIKEEEIQSLWSGYGKLSKFYLKGSSVSSVIVKHIQFPKDVDHPKGWNTNQSHLRKARSYEVELAWYKKWVERCNQNCKVPKLYHSESREGEHFLILEDLDAAGFPIRKSTLNIKQAKLGLKWLANFHATFMEDEPKSLWKEGTYWHLDTRPDEWKAMADGPLKNKAKKIDQILLNCQYQTIIHGDAKVANFCFSEDMRKVAAVDFQYVGGGCGMKDVVYFLGSCLSEKACEEHEEKLLDYYFNKLKAGLIKKNKSLNYLALEKEWRSLYPIAWTDFTRFLMGWMPSHPKLNSYSESLIRRAFEELLK